MNLPTQNISEKLETRSPGHWLSVNRPAFRFALCAYLFQRVITSLILAISALLLPQPPWLTSLYDPAVVTSISQMGAFGKVFLLPWYRWDTVNYLALAEQGYSGNPRLSVWPPLYSSWIGIFHQLGIPSLAAALLISNIAALLAYYLLYGLVERQWGKETAERTVLLTIAFPTGFFFIAGYTESLFLCFVLAFFAFLQEDKPLFAGVMASLATLTRIQGIFLGIPLLAFIIQKFIIKRVKTKRDGLQSIAALALPALTFGLFALSIFGIIGQWPWNTLAGGWEQHFGIPIEGFWGNFTALLGRPVAPEFNFLALLTDLLLGVWAVYGFIKAIRQQPGIYLLYTGVMLLIVTSKLDNTSVLVSLSRYVLVLFPLFIQQARCWTGKIGFILWLAASACWQFVLLLAFYYWLWVA